MGIPTSNRYWRIQGFAGHAVIFETRVKGLRGLPMAQSVLARRSITVVICCYDLGSF